MMAQAPLPGGFRVIGNIYWVGAEYGSYLITTPQGRRSSLQTSSFTTTARISDVR